MQIKQGVQNTLLVKGELQNKMQTWSHLCTCSYAHTYRVNVSKTTRPPWLQLEWPGQGVGSPTDCSFPISSAFWTAPHTTLTFTKQKELHQCPVWLTKRNPQRVLAFAETAFPVLGSERGGRLCSLKPRAWRPPAPARGTALSVQVQPRELGTGPVSMCALPDSLCASIGKTCSKVPEKPQRDYFGGYGNAQNISHVIYDNCFFTLHTILAHKRFHRNALLSDSGGVLY